MRELNEEQLRAVVDGDGACLVLAGAGSGKTRVITYRVAYLLEQGIRPEEILLVTFTNKAAREMVNRISDLFNGEVNLPFAGTFHHIAFKILKLYAPVLGYKNSFSVLDSEDSSSLIKMCVKELGFDNKPGQKFPSAKILQDILSYARNSEESIDGVIELKYGHFLEFAEDVRAIGAEYEKRKKSANNMDFDDLLINLLRLLSGFPEIRNKFCAQFRYILVDEYQDTNKTQDSIIKLLSSDQTNIFVVGDDAQSIYSFRAANIQNILDFPKAYPGTKIFKLETNYRSTPNILDVANDVINRNKNQFKKSLKSARDGELTPELRGFLNQKEEAEFIVRKIKELEKDEMPRKEIAVLFRSAHHSQALEMELNARGIAYEYRGGIRFFERSHIKDILAFLRIYSNIQDSVAWSRALNMQAGIGPATARDIVEIASKFDSLENLLAVQINLPARAQVGWNDFTQILKNIISVQDKRPAELIKALLESKYVLYLKEEHDNFRDRIQDIEQLASFASTNEDLGKFLAEAALQEGYNALDESKYGEEKIILSTIHQAKGLEWEAVFIINISSGQFPNERAMRERSGVEEERRLFYVAITRAKTHLLLSYNETGGFGELFAGPSLFVTELNMENIADAEQSRTSSVFTQSEFDSSDDLTYEPFEDELPKKRSGFLKSIDEL